MALQEALPVSPFDEMIRGGDGACIAAVLAAQAARTPDAPALVCGGRTMSYAQLHAWAARVAHALRARGVRPESRVGVCLERSAELAVAVLAVIKAGGAWVPIDPGYPPERQALVLDDARVSVLLTRERLRAGLGATRAALLLLDDHADEIAGHPSHDPPCAAGPGNLAYVMYTSGSTGRPKGVMCERGTLLEYLRTLGPLLGVGPGDGYLHAASFSFSVSVRQLLLPLLNGARVVMALRDEVADAGVLLRLVKEHGVTVADVVPSFWQGWIYALERLDPPARAGLLDNALRLMIAGGEALPASVPRAWRALGHGARMANLYGQTEATGVSALHLMDDPPPEGDRLVPVGRALPGTRVHLLDDDLRPVAEGEAGEVCVAGSGPARGYLGRPAMTAEKFVPDPFSATPGARMYRTGDRARRLSGGELLFLGRADNRVKVRGFRVEVEEVEAALRRHPRLLDCAVGLRGQGDEGGRLAAWVVPGPQAPTVPELRAHLAGLLPDYMVPAHFAAVDRVPRTPNGKVDRRALAAAEGRPLELSGGHVAPRTAMEEALAGVWAEVLGAEGVGVHDDFFALGGDSLLAMRVSARVAQLFGADLPLALLFEHPTVAGLAAQVERASAPASADGASAAEDDGPGAPLSITQERLWIKEVAGASPDVLFRRFRLAGAPRLDALQAALDAVLARHDALRTSFHAAESGPRQVVELHRPAALPVVDLSGLSREAASAEVERWKDDLYWRGFDLARPPLARLVVFRLEAEVHDLLFATHHVVSDAWSVYLFFRELEEGYAARVEGRPPALPELVSDYAAFARRQRRFLSSEGLEAGRAYWRRRLEGAEPTIHRVADHPGEVGTFARTASARVALDEPLTAALGEVGRARGATAFATFLALYGVLLRSWTGRGDFTVYTFTAGRSWPGTDVLIGCFAEGWLLRMDVGGDPAFGELLARVRGQVLADIAQTALEVGLLHARAESPPHLGDVGFAFTDRVMQPPALPGLKSDWVRVEQSGPMSGGVHFGIANTPLGIRGAIEFNPRLLLSSTAERMARRFERLARAVAADPDAPLSTLCADLAAAEAREDLERQAELSHLALQRLRRAPARRTG